MPKRGRYSASALIALFTGAACSQGEAPNDAGDPEYREVPEAAAACGLNRHAVVNRRMEGPQNNLMILPFYDNTTEQMREAKACLRRWAEEHGYIFLENESRADD
jgi:hypothetical protein